METELQKLIPAPYVNKSIKTTVNSETIWHSNKIINMLLKLKRFFYKSKNYKNYEKFLKIKVPSGHYNTFDIDSELTPSEKRERENGPLNNGPFLDWNKVPLDDMVEILRKKYMFLSTPESKCINELISFYDKHKKSSIN